MGNDRADWIPTRKSLLSRLKHWDDQESWRDFFDTYWRLIYGAAMRSGLDDSESQEVVQDTVIAVAKKMAKFRYDPAVDSFKGWLLYLTRKRIALAYRRRERDRRLRRQPDDLKRSEEGCIDNIPDKATVDLEAHWEEEWERNLFEAAIEKVKQQASLKQFQMFDLYVLKEWPVRKAAETLGVTPAQIYLAKHRISALIKKELDRLKSRPL